VNVALLFPPCVDPRAPYLGLPSLAAFLRHHGIGVTLRDLNLEGLLEVAPPEAVQVLRSDGFYRAHDFDRARMSIQRSLQAAGQALERPVDYGILPITYHVPERHVSVLADLLDVTGDDRANVFAGLYRRVIADLQARNPRLVGVAIQNGQQIVPGLLLARRLKEAGFYTVIGGAVYTKFVAALATRPAFFEAFCDGLVAYEGETALLELVAQLDGRRDFSKVPNYLFLQGGEVRVNPTRVEDVRGLPTPDFEGLPLDQYLAPAPVLPILTGKGCYFNRCKFCDIPYINHISKKAYRVRDPEQVVADVGVLAARHGARHFVITDEALSPRLLLDLADAFEASDVPPRALVGYARLEPGFTAETCQRLADMGLRKLFFGLESGAQKTIDHMDKGIRMEHVAPVLKNCRSAGIAFHLFSMIGHPEETEAEARQTLQFFLDHVDVISHPSNSWDVHRFSLDERTPYFRDREQYGITLDPSAWEARDFALSAGRDWTNGRGMTHERVGELLDEFYQRLRQAYRAWHDHPQHLWPGFEEYAGLYATWYHGRSFPYRTSLPGDTDPQVCRLRWSPALTTESQDGWVAIRTPRYSARVEQAFFETVAPCDGTSAALLDRLASPTQSREQSRTAINQLLSTLFLELELL
jgi:hypothetical protein